MRVALWRGLFDLRGEVDRVASAAGRALAEAHDECDSTSRSALVLSSLHLEVRQLVETFAGALEATFEPAASWAVDRALRLVAFWLNERIRRALPVRDRADWEPVGPAGVDLRNGGRLFFQDVERILLELPKGPGPGTAGMNALATQTLADIALFCLEEGFTGEHTESVGTLQRYKESLRQPAPPRVAPPVDEGAAPSPLRSAPMAAAWCGVCLAFYALCVVVMGWWGGG